MICRHCGRDLRLTKEERSARQREVLGRSAKKLGAKRRIDYDMVRLMREDGLKLREIARLVGCTEPSVCRVLKKFKGKE